MRHLVFDVGISSELVMRHLRAARVLAIVGYRHSGKSTLAETLLEDLSAAGYNVLMQNASTWIRRAPGQGDRDGSRERVDPEIVSALSRFEASDRKCCWILDDAEVALAYAGEQMLRSLGEQVQKGTLDLIMIRNRFVLEDRGWFHGREALVAPGIEHLTMRPLDELRARAAATTLFHGPAREVQGEWLAHMSGGIPGLMSSLLRYTPDWPSQELHPGLERLAGQRRHELGLSKPLRRDLIRALEQKILPPAAFLTASAKAELGALMLSGMVSSTYFTADNPLNGEFWTLVAGPRDRPRPSLDPWTDIGLSLEIMIRDTGLQDVLGQEWGLPDSETMLGQAFAAVLACGQRFPTLVEPLENVLVDALGRLGLAKILHSQGRKARPGAGGAELYGELLTLAGAP